MSGTAGYESSNDRHYREMAARERAVTLACRREHFASWVVIQYHGNASAFNGYHWTPSAYSCVRCTSCGRVWRTKAAYVETLQIAPPHATGRAGDPRTGPDGTWDG